MRTWPPRRPKDEPPLEGADFYLTIGFYGFCMTLIVAVVGLLASGGDWEPLNEPSYWVIRFFVSCLIAFFYDPASILKD